MAAMKSLLLCLVVAVAAQQASAASVLTQDWKVPITVSNTIDLGSTIIWVWADTAPHNIQFLTFPMGFTGVPVNGSSNQIIIPPVSIKGPYNVSFTPTIPGTYTYVCTVHSSMTGTLVVLAAATANSTTPTVANTTANATTTTASNTTTAQVAVVARTLGFANAAVTQNATAVLTYITSDFTAFAANVSGPLTISNASAILGYFQTNLGIAARNSPLANVTPPVVKQFILTTPTSALITVQVPVLQHFATILWTYLNNTNYTANWYAKTGVFTPAPISTA